MAPELMAEEVPNELSDMYGFCVVIWELFNSKWLNISEDPTNMPRDHLSRKNP